MSTNNITSGKVPARRGNKPLQDDAVPQFQGDAILEKKFGLVGDRGRLAEVQAQPVVGISNSTRDDLLRQAGVKVQRGRSIPGSR